VASKTSTTRRCPIKTDTDYSLRPTLFTCLGSGTLTKVYAKLQKCPCKYQPLPPVTRPTTRSHHSLTLSHSFLFLWPPAARRLRAPGHHGASRPPATIDVGPHLRLPCQRGRALSARAHPRCRGSRRPEPSPCVERQSRLACASRVAVAAGTGLHRPELSPCGGVARSSYCSCAMAARGTRSSCLWRPGPGLHRQELSPRASYRPSRLHESADALVPVMHALGWNGFGRCAWSARQREEEQLQRRREPSRDGANR